MCPCTCIFHFYSIVPVAGWEWLAERRGLDLDWQFSCQLHTLAHLPDRQQPLRWKIILLSTLWRWSIGTMSPVTIKDHSFANSGSPYLNELLFCSSSKNVQILNPYFCILCIFLKELLHMCPCTCIINFYLIVLERAWLGGNDQLREGVWVWTDNSPVNYTHWHFGQPDDRHQRGLINTEHKPICHRCKMCYPFFMSSSH